MTASANMRKSSYRSGFLWLMCGALLLSACGGETVDTSADSTQQPTGTEDGEDADSAAEPLSFTVAHPLPEGSHIDTAVKTFISEADAASEAGVDVRVVPNGELGSEAEMLEAMRLGSIEMVALTNGNYGSVEPKFQVFDIPYIWTDLNHFYEVINGPILEDVAGDTEEKGFVVLQLFMASIRNVYGNEKIESVADMEGVKIRVLEAPAFIKTFEAFGAVPTPVSWPETYQALQTGTVDVAETGLIHTISSKQYEVSEYAMITNHAISPTVVAVNADWWNGLSEQNRSAIESAWENGAQAGNEQAEEEEDAAIETLEGHGLEIVRPDLDEFREVARSVYPEFAETVGQDLIDKVVESGAS